MGERTKYTPGTFSWADLTTTDQAGAKTFYSDLFGWTAIDNDVGEGAVYSMMQLGGKDVAAISTQQQEQRDAGAPPAWNSYVTVENAEAAVDRAKALGATVHSPAFDVFDFGRMGVIQDPQGAYFLVWEPKGHIGASLVNAPGAFCWDELATPDMDASGKFYGELFGWTPEPFPGSEMPYSLIKRADGGTNGGIRNMMPGEPPYWLVYFGVDDIDAGLAKVSELGGTQMMGPAPVGETGKIGVVQDPQGAAFALYAGLFEE
jgi:predicted enzyme related to lactoylglutathione lyase